MEDVRTHPVGSRTLTKEHDESVRFGQRTESTEDKESNTRTRQDPESDSDEEVTEELVIENQGWRYSLRDRRVPQRFLEKERILLTDEGEPKIFEEAKKDTHNHKWLSAMQDEMDSLHENHTYKLTELPKGKRALRNKWVYKLKPGVSENPMRYKARIVVKGFQ